MPGDWSVGSDQVIAVGAQKLMPQNTAFWHFKLKKLLGVSDIPASHVLFQSLYLPKIQMHQGKELFFLPLPLRPGMWPHLNRPFHRLISVPHPFSLVIPTKFLFCPLSITCFAGMVVTLLSHLRGGKHCDSTCVHVNKTRKPFLQLIGLLWVDFSANLQMAKGRISSGLCMGNGDSRVFMGVLLKLGSWGPIWLRSLWSQDGKDGVG